MHHLERRVWGGRGETSPDARRMSSSVVACYEFAAPSLRPPARTLTPQGLFIATAVISLMVGCGWTVYANIFAASPYPELGSSNYDAPVTRRFASISVRPAPRIEPPLIAEPETVTTDPSLTFLERFAAASPEGVAPAPVPEEPVKIAVAPKPEPLKLAEAPKAKEGTRDAPKVPSKDAAREASRIQLASATPPAQAEEPKSGSKFADMARR